MTCALDRPRGVPRPLRQDRSGFPQDSGFSAKQFICARGGKVAGGVYQWESREAAERFYSGEWLAGIRARYGTEPKISYFETVALTDKATGKAGGLD